MDSEWSPAASDMIWIERTEKTYTDPATARTVAYGQIGEQLDMLYKDLAAGRDLAGTDALWYNHIRQVKENTTSPSSVEEVMDPTMTEEEVSDFMSDEQELRPLARRNFHRRSSLLGSVTLIGVELTTNLWYSIKN